MGCRWQGDRRKTDAQFRHETNGKAGVHQEGITRQDGGRTLHFLRTSWYLLMSVGDGLLQQGGGEVALLDLALQSALHRLAVRRVAVHQEQHKEVEHLVVLRVVHTLEVMMAGGCMYACCGMYERDS